MESRPMPRFMINYDAPDEEWQDEYADVQPMIGYGVQSPSTWRRYRVVDVWIINEKRGAVAPHGVHAFLEPVTEADDRLASTHPSYYAR